MPAHTQKISLSPKTLLLLNRYCFSHHVFLAPFRSTCDSMLNNNQLLLSMHVCMMAWAYIQHTWYTCARPAYSPNQHTGCSGCRERCHGYARLQLIAWRHVCTRHACNHQCQPLCMNSGSFIQASLQADWLVIVDSRRRSHCCCII